jgi:hypothetical protein
MRVGHRICPLGDCKETPRSCSHPKPKRDREHRDVFITSSSVSGCFRSSSPSDAEQRLLRYLAKVRVLEDVRSSGYFDIWQKSLYSSSGWQGGGGVRALYPLFGGRAKPRSHHSLEYRDNSHPDLEYRDNPTSNPFPLTNQGGAGQTQEKHSPPKHGR